MKKITFSLLLLLGLGFNSLFGATEVLYPYAVATERGDRVWEWDYFDNMTYSSGKYKTNESHGGKGFLYVVALGSGNVTAPVVGIGAYDLELQQIQYCNHPNYSSCRLYLYYSSEDTKSLIKIYSKDSEVSHSSYFLRSE